MTKEKEYILLLDSATEICSVALGKTDGTIVAKREEITPNKHSELLAPFADELLGKLPGAIKDHLRSVVISEGPGSYTGLRIGASYAKGLCWTLGIPLVTVPSTEALALNFLENAELDEILDKELDSSDALLLPMIDARRMEVYTAIYDTAGRIIPESEIKALILTKDEDLSYLKERLQNKRVYLFGSGATKAVEPIENLLGKAQVTFTDGITIGAAGMLKRGLEKLSKDETVDVGYWTPFYLKEFQATTPKKKY